MASATMLAAPQGNARISQLLPTVKCSSCHQPVPLTELGEHTCVPAAAVPTLPKPSISQQSMPSLLPDRLRGRVASSPSPPNVIPPPSQEQRGPPPDRLRINPNSNAPPPPRLSPLSQSSSGGDLQPPVRMDMRLRTTSLSSSASANNSGPPPPMPAGRERSPTYNAPPSDPRYPPSRTGTPAQPNGPPLGLPSSPRMSPTSPRLPFNAPPPPRTGPSPGPAPRGGPSPAPPMARNQLPPPPPQGGMPPPRSGMPPQRGPSPPSNPGGPPVMRPGMPPGPQGMRQGMPPPGSRAGGPPPPQGPPGPRPPVPMTRSTQDGLSGRMVPPPPLGSLPTRTGSPFILPPGTPGGPTRAYTPQLSPAMANFPPGQVISESDIDTKSGGEAGMAGVGRRGFQAVARAAMFAMPPKPSGARNDGPYLSSNVPPQSPTSPLSQSYFPSVQVPEPEKDDMARDLPKPPTKIDTSVSNLSITTDKTPIGDKDKTPMAAQPATPASPFGIRLPLFEKLKNMIPGQATPSSAEATPTKPEPEQPLPAPLTRDNSKSSNASSSDGSDLTRLRSTISSSSNSSSHPRVPIDRGPVSPISPTNESEYSGLAYARSDEDDDDGSRSRSSYRSSRSRKRSSPPPPPLPSNAAALARQLSRSTTATSNGRLAYSPEEERESRRGAIPIVNGARPRHARNDSGASSSYSSASSYDNSRRERANSAVIAQALGLSRTPSKEYGKIGGPGRPLVRSTSNSSSRSAYSRTASMLPANGPSAFDVLERSLLKDEAKRPDLAKSKSTPDVAARARAGSSTSRSGSTRATEYSEADSTSLPYGGGSGKAAQRSKTVQGITSPDRDSKPVKLPARSKTSASAEDRDKVNTDGPRVKKRKERVCVKCQKRVEDGRWIKVDTGSVLCEKCWKNMYLPKCRRCAKPIEKQAVSSSDGQLKGKYHKECFNCHTCHKPFPDKTFYVFDGKPYCGYHYHEANDSLCAEAKCGQPIEGPCAVSHAGDRYHPECMTCEHPGYPPCRERLEEYWEVDGRMLCEHHATVTTADDYGSQWAGSAKAMKRVTMFIDLTGGAGAGAGNNNNNRDDDDDSGLR